MSAVTRRRTKLARQAKMRFRHAGWAQGNPRALDIRAGDTVEITGGKDRGKRGVVERIVNPELRIVVSGINLMKRHTRASGQNYQGGIVDFHGPISYSNVQLVCNRCDKRTRIKHEIGEDGVSVIVCRKCGERYERASG